VAGTLIENSNSKPVVRRRRLAKRKHNLFANKPILISDNGTGEIAADNGKLPQPITKPEGIHQPNDIIDVFITASPTINTL